MKNNIKICKEFDINFYLSKDYLINKNIYDKIQSFPIFNCHLRKFFSHSNPSVNDNTIFCFEIDNKILIKLFVNLSGPISFCRCGGQLVNIIIKKQLMSFIILICFNSLIYK